MTGAVDASVIVGLVNGGSMIDALLDALALQVGPVSFEVIVASRCQDGTAERVSEKYPEVMLLRAEPGTTLPELRALCLARSSGRFVFVTEDHTVPPVDWISSLVSALEQAPESVAAAGGLVENGERDRVLDWASFLCEYSGYLPPLPAGETSDLPGMNIVYRREALERTDPALLSSGFWELNVHGRLLAEGRTLLRVPEVVIEHSKSFGFFTFASQRFHYSRWYAGARVQDRPRPVRLGFAFLSIALPALVLLRVTRQVFRRPTYRKHLWPSLPALACFALFWGFGETVGYLAGPGRSLAKIE